MKYITKESLLYNKYKYRLSIKHVRTKLYVPSYTISKRLLNTPTGTSVSDHFDRVMDRYYTSIYSNITKHTHITTDAKQIEKLTDDWVKTNSPIIFTMLNIVNEYQTTATKDKEYKLQILRSDNIVLYSNDLPFLTRIAQQTKSTIEEVVVTPKTHVKTFINPPKFKYRFYLRRTTMNKDDIHELKQTFEQYKHLIKPSQGLSYFISGNYYNMKWCIPQYFIDFNDEHIETILILRHSNVIGKKYKLEHAKAK